MSETMIFKTVFCGVFFIVGFIFICVSAGIRSCEKKKAAVCTEPAEAVVVENVPARIRKGSRTYAPVFEYSFAGRIIRRTSAVSSSPPMYSPGQHIPIMVEPKAPENYYIPGNKTVKILVCVFGVIGAVFTAVAVTAFILIK